MFRPTNLKGYSFSYPGAPNAGLALDLSPIRNARLRARRHAVLRWF